jgi:hypothetical protein
MKRLIVIILLFSASAVSASGFDDMILWRYNLPARSSTVFSLEPMNISEHGFKTIFLHTNPYGIGSLRWDYAGFKYGAGKWGIYGQARFYGLNELYTDNIAAFGASVEPYKNIALSAAITRETENFEGIDSYSRLDLSSRLSGSFSISAKTDFTGVICIDRINLKKPYEFPGIDNPEPTIYGSFNFDDNSLFSVGLKRYYTKKTRWFFNQSVSIAEGVDLQLGYINRPNVFNWDLDLSWKSFTFAFTYLAISKLGDTMTLGLSYGM